MILSKHNIYLTDDSKEVRTLEKINLYAIWVFGLSLLVDLFYTLIIESRLPSYGTYRLVILLILQLLSWTMGRNTSLQVRALITYASIYLAFSFILCYLLLHSLLRMSF